MNRDDLLKRCVDRRVAHETSVVAVSHLFYVYLLTALKKGQQVEVPNFGTFGTRMIGAKRQRRMPFFEVEQDLADKVNERYRNLKALLIGRYEMIPVEGEVEYTGTRPAFERDIPILGRDAGVGVAGDMPVDRIGGTESFKEPETLPIMPVPPPQEPVQPLQHEEPEAEQEVAPRLKERKLMPRPNLNLRDEGMQEETQPVSPVPEETGSPQVTLRDSSGGEGPSPLLQILLGLLILGAITFAMNHFGIIHLWGKKGPQVTQLPPPAQQPPVTQETPAETKPKEPDVKPEVQQKEPEQVVEETPTPTPVPKQPAKSPEITTPPKTVATVPPAGTGTYTVQVASFTSRSDANHAVTRLSGIGFDAYVAEGVVRGRTWYRVRVGRFATQADAQTAAAKLQGANETQVWVTRVD
jgi:cell division protein FtsN